MTSGAMRAVAEPSLFVIFGATGDLATRKLLPALFRLYEQRCMPAGCVVLGTSRDRAMTDDGFRALARDALAGQKLDAAAVEEWAGRWLHFQPVRDAADAGAFTARIEALEREHGLPGNRAFYLALPPGAFASTIQLIGEAGLHRGAGWTRIVVEKPFGRDLASARTLNELLHRWFDEEQIYRIDHYLGKETVQNLLVLRFANAMLEPLWNRHHVESVRITVAESLGVEDRAGYYEKAGALRDMVQSHLTQLLALVAMDVPGGIRPDAIRFEKLKLLQSILPLGADDVVLGQYAAGRVEERDVPGYREEPGVAPDSCTDTYAALRLHVENWRWEGVPFLLRTGKRLPRRLTEIEIRFRHAPVRMFRDLVHDPGLHQNTLVLTLQPNEGFCLYLDIKAPGEPYRIRQIPLHFDYAEAFAAIPEAYQTLLLDLLEGDQTLFVHALEVEESWGLYDPVLARGLPVHQYAAGSWGPREAEALWTP